MNTETTTPLQAAMSTLSKMPKIDIKGKQYASVASRVEAFRTHFETATIETIIICDDTQRVVIQARISINNNIIATGYAEEIRGEGWINSTSAIENCETSAIGRALSAFGLSGSEYASANEVTNAISQQQQNHKSANNTNQPQQNPSYPPNNQKQDYQAQTPYKHQQDFTQLINLGLQIVDDHNGNLIVTGDDIFAKKDAIKSYGFRWDVQNKLWYMPISQAA